MCANTVRQRVILVWANRDAEACPGSCAPTPVHPHKIQYYIQYYLERRDPEFDAEMVQVLHVYKEVAIWREKGRTAAGSGGGALR
jgi:hypothetical protein